jgi:glycine cleavage system H protein
MRWATSCSSNCRPSVRSSAPATTPVAGTVVAVNQPTADAPDSINTDAYSAWLFRLQPSDAAAIDGLLDATAYGKATAE